MDHSPTIVAAAPDARPVDRPARVAATLLLASGLVGGVSLVFLIAMFIAFGAGARSIGMTLGFAIGTDEIGIVPGAGVVQRSRDLGRAPSLIDADVADDVLLASVGDAQGAQPTGHGAARTGAQVQAHALQAQRSERCL